MTEGTTIGQSVLIKGDLKAEENLTIEGQVEGAIELNQNTVTVGPSGRVTAKVQAKTVEVQGQVTGNITATDKLSLRDGGNVLGDLTAPRVGIAEGATFKGKIDMQRSKTAKASAGSGAQASQPHVAASQ